MARYQHDCDCCVALGEHEEYDLYFCKQGGFEDTVIARYGVDGDYTSGMVFAKCFGPLAIAKERAIKQGLMT